MRTGKYELVIVWDNGEYETETEVLVCETPEDAERVRKSYYLAFGDQIQWSGVRAQLTR